MLDSSGAAFGLHTFCPNKSSKDLQKVIKCVICNQTDVSQNRTLLFKTMYNSRGTPTWCPRAPGSPRTASVFLLYLLFVYIGRF